MIVFGVGVLAQKTPNRYPNKYMLRGKQHAAGETARGKQLRGAGVSFVLDSVATDTV